MAIVDANYSFIYANVGCQGKISDGGVFRYTQFYRKMENNELYLPREIALPGRKLPMPYTLVADDAFALSTHTMKPYTTDISKGSPKRIFNYRLSRARRIVENAFGILASVFRIFRKPLEIKVESTVVDIVLTCVLLHNFLRAQPDASRYYSPRGCFDNEDASTGEVINGSWRDITRNDSGLQRLLSVPRKPPLRAEEIRDEFNDYFLTPNGSIPHQNQYL